jgi:L-amino acid N-acyltransferase YncA
METRSATPADAEAIAAIYNQGIADRMATFETRLRTAGEVRGSEWHSWVVLRRGLRPARRDFQSLSQHAGKSLAIGCILKMERCA